MLSRPVEYFATPQSNRSPVPPRTLSLCASRRNRSASSASNASLEWSDAYDADLFLVYAHSDKVRGGGVPYPQRLHDFDSALPQGGYSFGRLVAMELRE